ncbi:MAG: AraC family transcriptional regulator [Psychromonas sp.]
MLQDKLNKPIALIKTKYVKRFIEMLQLVEEDIYPIIEKVGLPEKVLNTDHPYIPEVPVRLLLEEIVDKCGMESYQKICWLACREMFIPYMLEKISDAKNLQELLNEFSEILKNESTQVSVNLQKTGDKIWLIREKPLDKQAWYVYAELFSICYLIELIRALTEKTWLPEAIAIQSKNIQLFEQLILIDNPQNSVPQIYQQRNVACISIAAEVLKRPFYHNETWSKPTKEDNTPTDFLSSLKVALPPYLHEGKLPIVKAAKIIGMGVRTLQRRLDKLGVNYTKVLEQVQLQEAQYYLKNSDVTITIIAVGLGYSDLPHFSRAFKRLAGISPSDYRKKNSSLYTTG